MAVDAPSLINGEVLQDRHYRQLLRGANGGTPGAFAGGVGADNNGAHGVLGTDHFVVTQTDTPSMAVKVSAGMAAITGTESAAQGPFPYYNDADVVLTVAAAHATQARKDLVIAVAGIAVPYLTVVTGTPHPSNPVDPSLAAYPNALVLRRINVPGGATAILDAHLTDDLRTYAGLAAVRPGAQKAEGIRTIGASAGPGLVTSGTTPLVILSVTFNAPVAGRIVFNANVLINKSDTGARYNATTHLDGGGSIAGATFNEASTLPLNSAFGVETAVSAGSHTIEVRLERTNGSGTATVNSGAWTRCNGIYVPT